MQRIFSCCLFVCLPLIWACGGPPAPPPELALSLEGKTFQPEQELVLKLQVKHFEWSTDIGGTNQKRTGHYTVFLDDIEQPLGSAATPTYTWKIPKDLKAGKHTLRVALRNNDRSPLDPPVEASVEWELENLNSKKANIKASANKVEVQAGDALQLTIALTNFKLTKIQGNPVNKEGEGHYHVYLDDATGNDYLTAAYKERTSVTIPPNTSEGEHTLRIALMNNNHTPIEPTAEANIEIKVLVEKEPTVTAKANKKKVSPNEELILSLTLENFVLAPRSIGKDNKEGQGHLRVYLDDKDDDDFLVESGDKSIPLRLPQGISIGKHTLRISLRNNDKSELRPKAEAKVEFEVVENKPPKVLATPNQTRVYQEGVIRLRVAVENFTLSSRSMGQANKPGEGHYHVYLDDEKGGNYLTVSAKELVDVTIPQGTSAGTHILRVVLVNNDHSPLQPTVEAKVDFRVTEDELPKLSAKSDVSTIEAGREVELSFTLKNFQLDEGNIGKINKFGTGHIHVYLDNKQGADFLYAGGKDKFKVRIPVETSAGKHRLRVVLMNSDNTPFTPKVESVVELDVSESTLPVVKATLDKTTVAAGERLEITVNTIRFSIKAPGGQNAPGEGHYHVYLDNNRGGNYLYAGTSTMVSLRIPQSTKSGAHTLRVSLRNNDHSPLDPIAEAFVKFTVK